jgi:alpha-mannosidase
MNNHWGTNYRAYQEGPTIFRYVLRPYSGKQNAVDATRFAMALSNPLLPTPASSERQDKPLLTLDSPAVVATALKPSDDGKALILRLFAPTPKNQTAHLRWGSRRPRSVCLSDTSEQAGQPVKDKVFVPGFGLVTLRVEL